MNKIFIATLKNYSRDNQELFLKAKFLLATILLAIVGLAITLVYTCYTFGVSSTTVLTQLVGLLIMLSALTFLIKGNYFLTVHVVLCTSFSVVWILMFTEPVASILIKLDTIVFIIGIMAAMPLMFFKTRKPMLFYFIANYAIFILFIYYLSQVADLTFREYVDYTFDNTIAMLFVFVIGYNLFTIYQQVLDSFRKELTERKKAEDSLEKFRLFLSSIINSMPSIIIGINENYNIVLWNEEASKVTGVSQKAASNKNLFEIFSQLSSFKDKINGVMETNTISKDNKKSLVCLDQKISMDITIYPLFHDNTGGAVIRLDDISERLKMEEIMMQSEKMLSLGGLAAGMAHEINNPLAGMMQNAQVALSRLTQNFPGNDIAAKKVGITIDALKAYMEERKIIKALEHINNAGRHAAGIVENMLSFAKNSQSPGQLEDLAAIVDNALELAKNDWNLSHLYDFKSIKISRKYDSELEPILCEKSKIQQVLFNIIKNASEAMNRNKIEDRNPEIIICLSKEKDMVRIEIEDNGPGMDGEVRKRIFEPFFTTKGVDKGTGLGLSVSYFIIAEDHDGKLDVESVLGKGTKFIISLPISKEGQIK